MKRLWKLGLACMLFLLMLSACSYQYRPTEGVWYCEKLDIYLDMDSPARACIWLKTAVMSRWCS